MLFNGIGCKMRHLNLILKIPCRYNTLKGEPNAHKYNTAVLFANGWWSNNKGKWATAPTSSRQERHYYFVWHQVTVSLPNHYRWPPGRSGVISRCSPCRADDDGVFDGRRSPVFLPVGELTARPRVVGISMAEVTKSRLASQWLVSQPVAATGTYWALSGTGTSPRRLLPADSKICILTPKIRGRFLQ